MNPPCIVHLSPWDIKNYNTSGKLAPRWASSLNPVQKLQKNLNVCKFYFVIDPHLSHSTIFFHCAFQLVICTKNIKGCNPLSNTVIHNKLALFYLNLAFLRSNTSRYVVTDFIFYVKCVPHNIYKTITWLTLRPEDVYSFPWEGKRWGFSFRRALATCLK